MEIGKKIRILVVDDHFLIRHIVSELFEHDFPVAVDTARDGKDACEAIITARNDNFPFDVVFLDWNMPTMTGIQVLERFKDREEHQDTSFVMLSAEGEPKQVKAALEMGAVDYIVKPASKGKIADSLRRVLTRRKIQAQKK